jgi:serine/threonine protein kinase
MTGTGHSGVLGPGTELDGFVIESVAGRGGMGVVYRARQRRPDRIVALKVIAANLADEPGFKARFQRESTIAAQIEHPNVIPVHAVGDADGILFIAMRFVDGTDLRSLLARERRLEPRRAVAIIDQVAHALDVAHSQGLVHRDVKPANILIASSGGLEHVYLTDFGLARHVEGSHGLTGTGAFLGTIDYVAPEQARGDRVDARTDVYSLGCVLFQTLTGTVPYPMNNDLAKLYAHDQREPPSPLERNPDLPATFEPVLRRAMAKQPEDRYLSAGDLGRAAVAAASGTPLSRAERSVAAGSAAPLEVSPVPPTPRVQEGGAEHATAVRSTSAVTQSPPPRARRSRVLGAVGIAIVVAVVVVVVLLSGGSSKPSRVASGPVTAAQPSSGNGGEGVVGLRLGRSIGLARLGEPRQRLTAQLIAAGYKVSPGSDPRELHFTNASGLYVIGFYGGSATYIQKYQDPSITVSGVSVDSTLRSAETRLPHWHLVKCQNATLLVAPSLHTYFYLQPQLDAPNNGGNGIAVQSDPVPLNPSSCG